MVVIRLARGGAKKRPFYNIVVADSRKSRDGRFIERVGYFNPIATGNEIELLIEKERVAYWTSQGAKTSNRVIYLLKQYEKMAKQETVTEKPKSAKGKTTGKVVEVQTEQVQAESKGEAQA